MRSGQRAREGLADEELGLRCVRGGWEVGGGKRKTKVNAEAKRQRDACWKVTCEASYIEKARLGNKGAANEKPPGKERCRGSGRDCRVALLPLCRFADECEKWLINRTSIQSLMHEFEVRLRPIIDS